MADAMDNSDTKCKVVEVSALSWIARKDVTAQPVDKENYLYQEVVLELENRIKPSYRLHDGQTKHGQELIQSMGMTGLTYCNGILTVFYSTGGESVCCFK